MDEFYEGGNEQAHICVVLIIHQLSFSQHWTNPLKVIFNKVGSCLFSMGEDASEATPIVDVTIVIFGEGRHAGRVK